MHNEYTEATATKQLAEELQLFPADPERTRLYRILLGVVILAALPFLTGVDQVIAERIDRLHAIETQQACAR